MKLITRAIIFIFFSIHIAQAQMLTGRISNQEGEPVKYATVYVQELRQGTTSNINGEYGIQLPPGKYTITYQSLGFQPVFTTITMPRGNIKKDIMLPIQYYSIPEVRITASGEDPANIIMRKVIGMAPYYLSNISYYKAEVYLKGNLVINKIPKLLRKSMKIESRNENGEEVSSTPMKEGDSYMMESFNEIEFTAPDKYLQKVISINSTFPSEGNQISPMDFIQASFYQPVLAGMAISPLSPAAFSHYNFKYLGASLQGNFTIDKIGVIPKRKSQQLLEGTIYIIEDLWCLHSVDLTNDNLAGKVRIQQLYIPVENDIWMPVSHKFDMTIGIMGFKADAGYGSSVKYTIVKPNLLLEKPKTITTDYNGRKEEAVRPRTTEATKERQQIEKILEKEDLSNRDMVRLSRLMEKESKKSLKDSSKNDLEIRDKTTHVIEKDAAMKDSAYWAAIRPIPLSSSEKRALTISDSTKAERKLKEIKNEPQTAAAKKDKKKVSKTFRDIVRGKTWSDTTGTSLSISGLVDLKKLSFNTVDGFVYGMDFRLTKSWKNGKSFNISPELDWAFSRKRLMWKVNANYQFNGLKQSQIYIRTGITSKDIGNGGSISALLNTATSLLLKENYLKLYESGYMTFGFRSEIINGLSVELNSSYEYRRVLENTTSFSLIPSSKEYTSNIPDNVYLAPGADSVNALRNQRHVDFLVKVTYVPFQKYRITGGKKIPAGSDWPDFSLTWQHGINEFTGYSPRLRHFDRLRFEVSQTIRSGALNEFRWRVRTGGFFDNRNLPFYDFFHFNSQSFPLLLNEYQDAFMLPSYYSQSMPEFFGEIHTQYTTPYLLLKFLPLLSNTLIRENISLSWLCSRFQRSYTELGYSLSEIFLIGELGVYAGFDGWNYKSTGMKIVLKFN